MTCHPCRTDNEGMKALELNRIAIWRPKLIDGLTIRESGAGRPFAENHIIKKTTAKTYRYAKNYEKKGVKFCLFAISYANDAKKAEAQLDTIAKKIKADEAKKMIANSTNATFEYTNYYLEDK